MPSAKRATRLLMATALVLLIPGEAATVLAEAEARATAQPAAARDV